MASPTNLQEIMSRFTRAAALICYNIKVKVEFDFLETTGFKFHSGECSNVDGQWIIKYNSAEYKEDEVPETSWYLLLHEVSHLKTIKHNKTFWDELAINFERTMELRKQFYDETNIEDNYNDMDYEEYFDEDSKPPKDAIIDEECLEWEERYLETYNIFRNVD